MPAGTQPIVYISYRWLHVVGHGHSDSKPDPHVRELADKLRTRGLDVRFDLYSRDSMYGFAPPQPFVGNPQDPWIIWLQQQIAEADAVLMYCTPDYADADPDHGTCPGAWWNWSQRDEQARITARVPGLWWDWLAIAREYPNRPQKFIPIRVGLYKGEQVPGFIRSATYLNLNDEESFEALLRRIRHVWRERVPRNSVFISYAHKDDQSWLDNLLKSLLWLKIRYNIEFWTDRDIEPGEKWHEKIQAALDRAKVAVLLVSPEFLASRYIANSELPKMLEAAESDGMKIFWIPVRPSSYERSPLAKFQAAHLTDKPLASLRGVARDQALVDISEKLAKILGIEED
jgi:hypothetical protein